MANRFLIVCGGSGSKLLGQRRTLGVSGEMHIDVSSEIKERAEDPRSLVVRLDELAGTIPQLLNSIKGRICESTTSGQSPPSDYIQTAITQSADINHARFLNEHFSGGGSLRDGLAQSPAIGGATVRHAGNVSVLQAELRKITTTFARDVGPQNPLDAWIISSTAGGTGEGIHRFVAATLADVLGKNFSASLKLNFVRIGALTFTSVGSRRTRLNTFFGVAADAAFELKLKEDYPDACVSWFYVDLPDVGKGDRGMQIRSEMIEMAVKAIMLDELAKDLDKLLINNPGVRMAIVRTGYWGKDFGENLKYYQTLRELAIKLKELIAPSPAKYIEKNSPPEYKGADELREVVRRLEESGEVLKKVQGGWKFPRYTAGLQVKEDRFKELVDEWRKAVRPLVAPREIGEFDIQFTTMETVTGEDGQPRSQELPLRVPALSTENTYDKFWVQGIDDAHRVQAWCSKLLYDAKDGLEPKLLGLAQACSDAQHSFNPFKGEAERARDLARSLGTFVETLEKVEHLLELEAGVARLLEAQLIRPKDILGLVEKQRDIAKNAVSGTLTSPVLAAELAEPLDRVTGESWLRLLDRAALQGQLSAFRQEVLRGATGLTLAGLINVLELAEASDATIINRTLRERMGKMYDPDGKDYEAPWWGATPPDGIQASYEYRILPRLEPGLQEKLSSAGKTDSQTRLVFTGLGMIGLYVLAFRGVSLNESPGPDTIKAAAYLLRPLVPVVREVLAKWVEKPKKHERSGQFEVVNAGVIGEPLYAKAMKAAGLLNEEMDKIGQFYQLYGEWERDQQPSAPQSQPSAPAAANP